MKTEIVQQLPKIELHCHLDGSVRPHILEELARQQQVILNLSSDELATAMSAPANCESLLDYLNCFDVVLPFLQQAPALELVAYDLIVQVAAENVRYIEVRYAPLLFSHQGLSMADIIQAVNAGLTRGATEFGVKVNTLLCGMRHHTTAQNLAVVAATKEFIGQGVVGFDLAGDEANFPTSEFTEIIELAQQQNIPLTLHAGECGCPKNVWDSIQLGATRVGHGVAIQKDSDLLAHCVADEIVIEMCPTSNLQTKAVSSQADYPLLKFLEAGARVCINTDNRTVSNTTLTKEYLQLHEWYTISYQQLADFNHNAIEGAFISMSEKEALHLEINKGYRGLI